MFETKRLILRKYKESDFDDYFEFMSQPDVASKCCLAPFKNKLLAKANFRHAVLKQGEDYAVVLKINNKIVGEVQLANVVYSPAELFGKNIKELGVVLNENFHHQGIMTEATREILRHGFEDLKLDAVIAKSFADNDASLHLLNRCGLKFHSKNAEKLCENKKKDIITSIITLKDYEKNKEK